jgi:glycosyltransferase involved in cell wall biosynthesis
MSKISVLIPIYNDERYISECLLSVKNQTFSEFECLIGFNGTTDNSKSIVHEIIKDDDRFVSFDFHDDKGKSKTLNRLFEISSGEYITILDGDDVWLPTKLEDQLGHMTKNSKTDVCSSWCYYCNEASEITGQLRTAETHDQIIEKCFSGDNQIVNSAFIARRYAIKTIGGWDETLPALEDYDMWIKLLRDGFRFYNIQNFLILHRLHSNSNFNAKDHGVYPGHILARNLK